MAPHWLPMLFSLLTTVFVLPPRKEFLAFIQPGGSISDKDSIEFCKQQNLAMVITGMRHFKH